jgi:hypothetical protein
VAKTHDIGSGPIDPKYKDMMKDVAITLDVFFNERTEPRQTGFVLLVFPFGEKEGRCNYISNGADRSDIIKLLREQANRFDEGVQ